MALTDWAVLNNSPNVAEFKSVITCGTRLLQRDNSTLTVLKPCGSRLCPMCSRRRAAHFGEILRPIVASDMWDFVTLNASNKDIAWTNPGEDVAALKDRFKTYRTMISKVKDAVRYEMGVPVDGVMVMECTKRPFSPPNPHIHAIVPRGMGPLFVKHWCRIAELNGLQAIAEGKNPPNLSKPADKGSVAEVLKYLIAPIIKSDSKKGKEWQTGERKTSMIDLAGTDAIITAMKGTRRMTLWGKFYDVEKKVRAVEDAHIEDLKGTKVVYTDLPVMDRGKEVTPKVSMRKMMVNGELIDCLSKPIPEFIREVVWKFDHKRGDWFYVDSFTGIEHALTGRSAYRFKELWTYAYGKRWRKPMQIGSNWVPYIENEF